MKPHSLFLGSLSFMLLAACVPTDGTSNGSSSSSSADTTRPLAQEGEFCGGIAGFQCDTGLTCNYEGDYPDAGGTCVQE